MKSIISALVGGSVFLIFLLVLKAGFIVALGISLLSLVACFLLMPKEQGDIRLSAMDQKQIDQIIKEGRQKVFSIQRTSSKITKNDVRKDIKEICDVAYWIFDNLKKHPNDIRAARQFLNYYLDTTVTIVVKYEELEKGVGYTQSQQDALEKARNTIALIKKTFEKQANKLVEDDFMNLEVEMDVLEKTIEAEGMLDD